MNKKAIQEWLRLSNQTKHNIFSEIANKLGLPDAAIEKDWWVVRTLELIFTTEVAPHTVFKGGTSLSKAWGLIDRFSEDIDLALDRKFLGFAENLSASQVSKLRKHSFKYISQVFFPLMQKAFTDAGFSNVNLQVGETTSNDQDPLIIEVNYPCVTDKSEYLQSRVLIEIGSRSLKEPYTEKHFCSLVGEHFKERTFADDNISIPTVNPERTFLEKLFLLHETFQQPAEKIKVNRLSRHWYDLEKLMDTKYAEKALVDKHLFQHIVEHRRTITPIRGIDYANHIPDKINLIPPYDFITAWKKDYEQMQQSMIYSESLSFDEIMKRITILKSRIKVLTNLPWQNTST